MGLQETVRQAVDKVEDLIGRGHDEDTHMSTQPVEPEPPQPEVHPSSTPSGPQVIPSPSTPPGEPGPDPSSEARASNPNAGGEAGLAGGMGVSSERTPDDPQSIEGTGSRGTATDKTDGQWPVLDPAMTEAPEHTQDPAEGPETTPSGEPRTTPDVPSEHPTDPAEGPEVSSPAGRPDLPVDRVPTSGPEMDDRQQAATQEWRENQPAANVGAAQSGDPTVRSGEDFGAFLDRTVGEENPAEVTKHEFDPTKNPGHSHS